MRSALKFLGLLAAFALFFLMVFVKPRGDIATFVGLWFSWMILLALPLLVILGLGMTAGEVIKEFDRRVTRLWTSRPSGTRQSSALVANIPAEQAFEGIYGQDDAVCTVKETIGAAQRGLQTRADGPLASFLFLGPTGVGKTELAYRIGALLRRPVVKFDLGDFADKHAAFRFTGAPPSYIGSDQPGQLAQAILEHGPYVVLLFDEITLAHPTIWDVLMGLLDKGSFQDGSTGRWFNLQQKIIIVMTSNALEEQAEELHHLPETAIRDLLSSPAGWRNVVGHDTPFRKAFAGRITQIVPFRPLSRDAVRAIIKDRLDTALASVKRRSRIELSYGNDAVEALAATISEARYGVREIDSVIYNALSPALADIPNEHLAWGKRGRLVIAEEGAVIS